MKDPVLRALGIRSKNSLTAETFDVVVRHLELFARGGGTVPWTLWSSLGTDTKAAFVAAFEKVRAEEAAAIGIASQGPRQAAQVMSVSDGGDLDCRLALDEYAGRLELLAAGRIS